MSEALAMSEVISSVFVLIFAGLLLVLIFYVAIKDFIQDYLTPPNKDNVKRDHTP
jgi:hypothetical protein